MNRLLVNQHGDFCYVAHTKNQNFINIRGMCFLGCNGNIAAYDSTVWPDAMLLDYTL